MQPRQTNMTFASKTDDNILSVQDFTEHKLRTRFSQLQSELKTTQDPSKRYLAMHEMMAINLDLVKIRLLKLNAELKSSDCGS